MVVGRFKSYNLDRLDILLNIMWKIVELILRKWGRLWLD